MLFFLNTMKFFSSKVIIDIYDLRFTIYDLRFTIYDLADLRDLRSDAFNFNDESIVNRPCR